MIYIVWWFDCLFVYYSVHRMRIGLNLSSGITPRCMRS